jgi:hypothetical protein
VVRRCSRQATAAVVSVSTGTGAGVLPTMVPAVVCCTCSASASTWPRSRRGMTPTSFVSARMVDSASNGSAVVLAERSARTVATASEASNISGGRLVPGASR